MEYLYITRTKELQDAAHELKGSSSICIDTEFNEERDSSELSLIQIHDGRTIRIIDCLKLRDLDSLRGPLTRSGVEWVLHAGSRDLRFLQEALVIDEVPPVFDTQVAWALQAPEFQVSLAYLQYRLLGIRSGKAHQADNLMARPLSQSQLDYAAGDVAHLPGIRRKLGDILHAKGLTGIVHDICREFAIKGPRTQRDLVIEDFRNAWQLDQRGLAALHWLISWYNGLTPEERERAPQKDVLFSIARQFPVSGRELAQIKGVPKRFAYRHGDSFTGRLVRAGDEAPAEGSGTMEPPAYITFAEISAQAWLGMARAHVSKAKGMAPEIVFPGHLLGDMQRAMLKSGSAGSALDALAGWRRDFFAGDLREFMERVPLPL